MAARSQHLILSSSHLYSYCQKTVGITPWSKWLDAFLSAAKNSGLADFETKKGYRQANRLLTRWVTDVRQLSLNMDSLISYQLSFRPPTTSQTRSRYIHCTMQIAALREVSVSQQGQPGQATALPLSGSFSSTFARGTYPAHSLTRLNVKAIPARIRQGRPSDKHPPKNVQSSTASGQGITW